MSDNGKINNISNIVEIFKELLDKHEKVETEKHNETIKSVNEIKEKIPIISKDIEILTQNVQKITENIEKLIDHNNSQDIEITKSTISISILKWIWGASGIGILVFVIKTMVFGI